MEDNIEYQIYIGCNDSQIKEEIISLEQLTDMVSGFFERNQVAFSLVRVHGGYFYDDGLFIHENTLCINIIGDSGLDIISLAKNLSMFMNQECSLVTRNPVSFQYR